MTTTHDAETLALHTSYFTLDARNHTVRGALIDAHRMHTLIMSGWRDAMFPGEATPRAALGILYALAPAADHRVRVVVQARTAPHWNFGDGILLGAVDQRLRQAPLAGTISFQLTAAPRKSTAPREHTPGAPRTRGRKIPLPPDQYEAWGRHTLARAGLDVADLTVRSGTRLESATKSLPRQQRPSPKAVFAHTTVTYTGTAHIIDPGAHREALTTGIGPAKAYGCGLLLTRPS